MRLRPLACLALLLAVGAAPAQAGSEKATQAAGLPPHAYAIQGKPSEVALNREADPAVARPAVKYAPVLGTPRTPVRGPYFGQPLPGQTPVPFAPEILEAINPWAEGVAFSPDGGECFLAVGSADYSGARTFHSTLLNGIWTPFVEPAFLSDFTYSNEPDFSADGRAVTFTGKKAAGSKDFWTARRTATGWGETVALPAPLNGDANEFRGSTALDGTIYFGSNRDGMMQIHRAARDASGTLAVERLGAPINARSFEGDPCVAPDGHFLVFYSARAGGHGGADLYVSFRDRKGAWGTPINLGPDFNSPDDEYGAHLSADGKLLFFTRHGARENRTFWVATSAIERFRP